MMSNFCLCDFDFLICGCGKIVLCDLIFEIK